MNGDMMDVIDWTRKSERVAQRLAASPRPWAFPSSLRAPRRLAFSRRLIRRIHSDGPPAAHTHAAKSSCIMRPHSSESHHITCKVGDVLAIITSLLASDSAHISLLIDNNNDNE
jgi:hypothetical protein